MPSPAHLGEGHGRCEDLGRAAPETRRRMGSGTCEHERGRRVGSEMVGLAGSGAVRVMEVGWPFGAALRGVVSNHRALRPLTAVRGERHGKGAPVSVPGVDREDERKRTVSDVSKPIQLTSKPGSVPHPGMSLGDTRLLPRRCPAYRQHEPDLGSRMERVKVSPRNCCREFR